MGQATEIDVKAEIQDEITSYPLEVTGEVPDWLSGTLVRNGPIQVTLDGKSNEHWFDGLAMLHAFSFHEGVVHYTNKFLRSDAYDTVFNKGSLGYGGFAADPSAPVIHNANVNVAKFADEYVALTEDPFPVQFDFETLDTLGVLDFQDQLPKEGCWESAHPRYDFHEKKTFNYLTKFGEDSYYILYSLEEGSDEREVIAKIPVKEPAYMHSFAMTENYIVLTEFPFVVQPLDFALKNDAFIKNFNWKPERGTRFIVVNKHTGDLVGEYTTKPFFAFHHANAFERDNMVHIDLVTFEDATVITGDALYVNSDSPSIDNSLSQLERFSVSLETGEITSEILLQKPNEFPRINEQLDGRPYHYAYLVAFEEKNEAKEDFMKTIGLYKVNTVTKEVVEWVEEGLSPGEPVFIAAPDAKEEDEGVLLAVVSDTIHKDSFLLILDAQNFEELGRARVPLVIPPGLHGQYFDTSFVPSSKN